MRLRDASSRSRRHRPRPRGQGVLAQAIAAHQRFRTDSRCAFAIPGKHLDHPAGVTAVLCRRRAAQHFDAIGGIEAEGRRLTWPSGGRRGCHRRSTSGRVPKGRARAEAVRRDLQILRVILAISRHQPRHPVEHFRGIDAQLPVVDLLAADAVD